MMQISMNKCTVMQHWTQFKLLIAMERLSLSLNYSRCLVVTMVVTEDNFMETFLWKKRTTSICLFKDFFKKQ